MSAPITRIQTGTNAELIATAQALYPMEGRVLDLTPGTAEGFWTKHRPDELGLLRDEDFRRTELPGASYAHVVFDPPYVAKGGHKTSTISEMNDRYGMLHVEKNPELQWSRQIVPGIAEAHRLIADDGLLWFKCMDYVTAGRVHWFTKRALALFQATGWFELVDEFLLNGHTGPQPTTTKCGKCKGSGQMSFGLPSNGPEKCSFCDGAGAIPRRQVHARNTHSALLIARKR